MITTSVTGEPVIATMELDDSNVAAAPFRPKKIGITAYQLWQVQKLRKDTRKEYLDHWEATVSETGTGRPVDAIICPASSYAATPHGKNRSRSMLFGVDLSLRRMYRYTNYTTVWNALDYPAMTFPVTTVDPTLDAKKPPHVFYDDFDKGIYNMCEYSSAPSDFYVGQRSIQMTQRYSRMRRFACNLWVALWKKRQS
jgi:hypothetical protein